MENDSALLRARNPGPEIQRWGSGEEGEDEAKAKDGTEINGNAKYRKEFTTCIMVCVGKSGCESEPRIYPVKGRSVLS